MNRLIIVGNGFDLAHGLKTSYKDFIIWYLAKCFGERVYLRSIYRDELLHIEFNDFHSFVGAVTAHKQGYHSGYTMDDLTCFIANHFKEGTIKEILNITAKDISNSILTSDDDTYEPNYNGIGPFRVNVLSNLLRSLIINCQDCNWVDIENEYFDQLKACKIKDEFDEKKVRQLNSEFAYLRQKLEEYLTIQQEQANIIVIPQLLGEIESRFQYLDFNMTMTIKDFDENFMSYPDKGIHKLNKLYFLNFNYTNTLKSYLDKLDTRLIEFGEIEVNHIHGELGNSSNPIIFGFGDEHDKQYLEFEEQRNNALFEHIKSYQYLRTPNYRNLINHLNSGEYQVFVMGHSCGLSDRTMFKEIFEHENCKSIRLFHYNGDFHDKAINVSKHFSNKGHMRKLIVDYKLSDAFPQVK